MNNSAIVETRIPVSALALGMRVVRLDRDWLETDFPVQGFMIISQSDIDALQAQCEHVYVEGWVDSGPPKPRSRSHPQGKGYQAPAQRVQYINKIPMGEELAAATATFRQARSLASSILQSVRLGRTLDVNRCRAVITDTVDSLLRNHQALQWLTQVKHKDEYTAEHSMNVCVLSALFARHLGLIRGEIETVALCGLLHDVGKIRVGDDILNKEGAYTPDEFDAMKMHPVHGRDVLMGTPSLPGIAVDVAYSHHERVSGNGYPRALAAEQIPYYAKIVSIVDTYDAITSNRCYDRARSSKEALDIIYRCRGEQFDEELALSFIQCIGIYPAGSIIETRSGEVAIVIRANPSNRLRPRLLLVRDSDKRERPERVVDLMRLDLNAEGQPFQIVRELPNGCYGVDLADYIGNGLVLRDH